MVYRLQARTEAPDSENIGPCGKRTVQQHTAFLRLFLSQEEIAHFYSWMMKRLTTFFTRGILAQ